jgi:hypothetical protein
VIAPIYVPLRLSVVGDVLATPPVKIASPVMPANSPVPPVNWRSISVVAVPCPDAVPSPELVPNKVPPGNVSVNVPLEMVMQGGLEKSAVDVVWAVMFPRHESVPAPVKFCL